MGHEGAAQQAAEEPAISAPDVAAVPTVMSHFEITVCAAFSAHSAAASARCSSIPRMPRAPRRGGRREWSGLVKEVEKGRGGAETNFQFSIVS